MPLGLACACGTSLAHSVAVVVAVVEVAVADNQGSLVLPVITLCLPAEHRSSQTMGLAPVPDPAI